VEKIKISQKNSRNRKSEFEGLSSPKIDHVINDFKRYEHLPMSQTPALIAAKKGHLHNCDANVDKYVYWNDPQGKRDLEFKTPFGASQTENKRSDQNTNYVTFEFDLGGWNNIRMSMEIIFIFAAVTNRTIVLPPDEELYYLNFKSSGHIGKSSGLRDYFALEDFKNGNSKNIPPIISAEEFIERECHSKGRFPLREENRILFNQIAKQCENRKKSLTFCGKLFAHYMNYSYVPHWQMGSRGSCVIFDEDFYVKNTITSSNKEFVEEFCQERQIVYFNSTMNTSPIIHFHTSNMTYRLLDNFYSFFFFTNPKISNYYKRFVRDHIHYNDIIYCTAAKIIRDLQEEGKSLGFIMNGTNKESNGYYSSLHIRRGDLQFKDSVIPPELWVRNTKDVFFQNEVLFIATDEQNITIFDTFKKLYKIRFLSDFDTSQVNPAFFGMIDTIVASYGRDFVGTSYSTFTNYINRLRGYHGFSMNSSWFNILADKEDMHYWDDFERTHKASFEREWPDAWVRIDGDEFVTQTYF